MTTHKIYSDKLYIKHIHTKTQERSSLHWVKHEISDNLFLLVNAELDILTLGIYWSIILHDKTFRNITIYTKMLEMISIQKAEQTNDIHD